MRLSKVELGLGAVIVLVIIAMVSFLLPGPVGTREVTSGESGGPKVTAMRGKTDSVLYAQRSESTKLLPKKRSAAEDKVRRLPDSAATGEVSKAKEEKRLAAAKAVEDWEKLVDKLVETQDAPNKERMAEVKEAFDKLNKKDQGEAVTRALNLLQDEQFPSLYGILFDKTENVEILDAIFSDALNRPEDIKVPLMKGLVTDKTHPMFFESARILDVTGELAKMSDKDEDSDEPVDDEDATMVDVLRPSQDQATPAVQQITP